jgi:hypothetical protein
MLDSTYFFVATTDRAIVASISGTTISLGTSTPAPNTTNWLNVSTSKVLCWTTTNYLHTFDISGSTISAYVQTSFSNYNPATSLLYTNGSNATRNVHKLSSTLIALYSYTCWYWQQVLAYQPTIFIIDVSSSTPVIKGWTKINSPYNPAQGSHTLLMGGTDIVILNQEPYKQYVVFLHEGGYYFQGIAETSQTGGQTVSVITNSARSSIFTGLTPGVYYYVDVDGTVVGQTSDTGYPEINGRRFCVGQACSTTAITNLLKTPDIYRTEGVQD